MRSHAVEGRQNRFWLSGESLTQWERPMPKKTHIHISAEFQSADVAVFRRLVHFFAPGLSILGGLAFLRMIGVRWYFPTQRDFRSRCGSYGSGVRIAQPGMFGNVWECQSCQLGVGSTENGGHEYDDMFIGFWSSFPVPPNNLIGSRTQFAPLHATSPTSRTEIGSIFDSVRAKWGYGACIRCPPEIASIARD